ncbi:MAG TPA: hypothetical protein VF298_09655, partial [Bacteroidales bacterium]
MKSFIWKAQWAFLILFLICTIAVSAQKEPIKYGKIDENDLKMTVYPMDSSAHAVVLCDYGTSNFQYDALGDKGWQVSFKRVVRIKVLDKEGVSAGDFQFKLYHSENNNNRESLTNIDGTTFNFENGKVVKSKLENRNVMKEDEDKNNIAVKFAMPNVRAWSVIDVSYTIVSDFVFNLQPWKFQTYIPVKWSEYITNVPEYFIYKHAMLGYNSLAVNESTTTRGTILFTNTTRPDPREAQPSIERSMVEYRIDKTRMAMGNVPAFKEEAYLTSADNYRSIYTSELASSKGSDGMYKDYTTTWDKINRLLLESEDFGTAMKRAGYMDDEI